MNVKKPGNTDWIAAMNGRVIGIAPSLLGEFIFGPGGKMPAVDMAEMERQVARFARVVRDIAPRKHAQAAAPKGTLQRPAASLVPPKPVSRITEFLGGVACHYDEVCRRAIGMNEGERPYLFRKGCFDQALASGKDVSFRPGHSDPEILASLREGTLRLQDGRSGLFFTLNNMAATAAAQRFMSGVRAGNLTECSIEVVIEDWVPYPAYLAVTKARPIAVTPAAPGEGACPNTWLKIN